MPSQPHCAHPENATGALCKTMTNTPSGSPAQCGTMAGVGQKARAPTVSPNPKPARAAPPYMQDCF